MQAKSPTPNHDRLMQLGGWIGGSIGQYEALAGVNIQCEAERKVLWNQFRDLMWGDTQILIDAVMEHCAKITLRRVKRGELCIIPILH